MPRVFGLTTTGISGVLQNVTTSESAEVADALGADGKVTDQKAYTKTFNLKAEFLFDSGTPLVAGEKLTVSGKEYLIKSVEFKESNKEFQSGSVELELKDAAAVTPYQTTT